MTLSKIKYPLLVLFVLLLISPPLGIASDPSDDRKKDSYVFYSGAHSPIFELLDRRLQEAFSRIGLTVQLIQTKSAQRALELANTDGDGDALRVPNLKEISPDKTDNLLQIPEPILMHSMSAYAINKSLIINGWESLNGLQNGIRKGVKILEQKVPETQVILPSSDRLFQMLATDRLDTVIEWDLIAEKMIRDLQLSNISKLSPPIYTTPTHTYIHKKHKALVSQISNTFAKMRKDGTFLKIKKDIIKL